MARVPATFGRIVVDSTDVQLGNDPSSKGREGGEGRRIGPREARKKACVGGWPPIHNMRGGRRWCISLSV